MTIYDLDEFRKKKQQKITEQEKEDRAILMDLVAIFFQVTEKKISSLDLYAIGEDVVKFRHEQTIYSVREELLFGDIEDDQFLLKDPLLNRLLNIMPGKIHIWDSKWLSETTKELFRNLFGEEVLFL